MDHFVLAKDCSSSPCSAWPILIPKLITTNSPQTSLKSMGYLSINQGALTTGKNSITGSSLICAQLDKRVVLPEAENGRVNPDQFKLALNWGQPNPTGSCGNLFFCRPNTSTPLSWILIDHNWIYPLPNIYGRIPIAVLNAAFKPWWSKTLTGLVWVPKKVTM